MRGYVCPYVCTSGVDLVIRLRDMLLSSDVRTRDKTRVVVVDLLMCLLVPVRSVSAVMWLWDRNFTRNSNACMCTTTELLYSGVQIVYGRFQQCTTKWCLSVLCVVQQSLRKTHAHARTCQRTRSVNVHQDYMLQPYVRVYTKKCKTRRVRHAAKTVNLLCVK